MSREKNSGMPPLGSAKVGAAILGTCALLARSNSVSVTEQRVFEKLNSGIGAAERPVWAAMQLGNGLTAVVAPAAIVCSGRSKDDALRVGMAAFGGWQLAKLVKRTIPRGRPSVLLGEVVLRDGDPDGGGFVSGHATVAMAIAVTAGSIYGPPTRRAGGVAAVIVALARVHVGAHLPLDVLGGAGLGLLWGSVCSMVRAPRRSGSAA